MNNDVAMQKIRSPLGGKGDFEGLLRISGNQTIKRGDRLCDPPFSLSGMDWFRSGQLPMPVMAGMNMIHGKAMPQRDCCGW